MSNKIINEQVDRYYKSKEIKKNRSNSYTSGLDKKPRTVPSNLITYHEEILENSDDNESTDDNLFFDFGLKKRNYSISNYNPRETLFYEKQLPKKVGYYIDDDSIEDLTKLEHDSIVNEMKHFYITFTSKIEHFEDKENDENIINKNSQEKNKRENKILNISLDNNNFDTNITTNLIKNINEGINIKTIPITRTCEICTNGDIKNEEYDSSEDLLKQIHQSDSNGLNNENNNNLESSNHNLSHTPINNYYNKDHNHNNYTISDSNDDYDHNNYYIHRNRNHINVYFNNSPNDDNTNSDNNASNVEVTEPLSMSSFSFTNESSVTAPRRRSSVLHVLFRNKNRNNSVNAISSRHSFSANDFSRYSINTVDSSDVKSNKDTTVSQLFNITEGSRMNSIISSYTSSFNNDINDILNIGATSPILEEEPNINESSKKKKDKKNKNVRKKSTLIDMKYDMDEVFKHPNIELIGRSSSENIVVSVFLAEKLRKILPPYYRECQKWEMVFSIVDHGSSITTLLNKCEETQLTGPFILAIFDTDGYIYGAYLSEGIHVCKRFYGSGECFLWKLNNEKKEVEYYRGSVENQYHIVTEKSFIAFGGGNGDFGLYISSDLLNGYTSHSPTYNNPPLTPNGKFECLNIEIWGFSFK